MNLITWKLNFITFKHIPAIDDAQETVLSLQEEAMYERFLSDTVRFTSSYLTIEPEKWWSEVASLKDWYSKLQAMRSPYITTEGFAIQFKSHEYYIIL